MTQGSTIALNVLVMNLEKLLELLFVLFAYWLQLLLYNQPGKASRFVCLSTLLRHTCTASLRLTQARRFDSMTSLSLSQEALMNNLMRQKS